MSTTVKLVDRDGSVIATFESIPREIDSVGVVLYRGDYFTFQSLVIGGEGRLILIYGVANIMEVKA